MKRNVLYGYLFILPVVGGYLVFSLFPTLYVLKPVILFFLITGFIGSFQVFDTVFAMTKGGPGVSTKVYYYLLYQEGFAFLHMGYASALSVVLFAILMTVTLIQFRFFRNTTYDMS